MGRGGGEIAYHGGCVVVGVGGGSVDLQGMLWMGAERAVGRVVD